MSPGLVVAKHKSEGPDFCQQAAVSASRDCVALIQFLSHLLGCDDTRLVRRLEVLQGAEKTSLTGRTSFL